MESGSLRNLPGTLSRMLSRSNCVRAPVLAFSFGAICRVQLRMEDAERLVEPMTQNHNAHATLQPLALDRVGNCEIFVGQAQCTCEVMLPDATLDQHRMSGEQDRQQHGVKPDGIQRKRMVLKAVQQRYCERPSVGTQTMRTTVVGKIWQTRGCNYRRINQYRPQYAGASIVTISSTNATIRQCNCSR